MRARYMHQCGFLEASGPKIDKLRRALHTPGPDKPAGRTSNARHLRIHGRGGGAVCESLLWHLGDIVAASGRIPEGVLVRWAMLLLSVTLQRGNAEMYVCMYV